MTAATSPAPVKKPRKLPHLSPLQEQLLGYLRSPLARAKLDGPSLNALADVVMRHQRAVFAACSGLETRGLVTRGFDTLTYNYTWTAVEDGSKVCT